MESAASQFVAYLGIGVMDTTSVTRTEQAVTTLREWIALSPAHGPQHSLDLLGWRNESGQVVICAHCAGRLSARGVAWARIVGRPIWIDTNSELGSCCACGKLIGER